MGWSISGCYALGLAFLLAGCEEPIAAEGPGGAPAATVTVAPVEATELAVEWRVFAEVRARREAELAAGADGEVTRVWVHEGDQVEAGQLLVAVDPSLARANLASARAATARTAEERAQAAREAQRFSRAGTSLVPGVDIERATSREAQLAAESTSLEAEVARAHATLRRHEVRAPFAGVVTRRLVDPGDWVSPGTPALEVVSDAELEVLARVGADVLAHVRAGDAAEILTGRGPVPARVEGVVRALDPRTRTATLRLLVDEEQGGQRSALLAGASVEVLVRAQVSADRAVVVHRDALVQGPAGARVIKYAPDQSAAPVAVEVLETNLEGALVRPGPGAETLAIGDRVVTRGNERLRPGQALRIIGHAEAETPAR